MSIPLRVNGGLYKEAEAEVALLNRSTAKQVEFWAELGKQVAHSLTHAELIALMQGIAKVSVEVFTSKPINPKDVFAAVDLVNLTKTLGTQITRSALYYEASKSRPGLLDQVMPDGTRRSGHFSNGSFLPE